MNDLLPDIFIKLKTDLVELLNELSQLASDTRQYNVKMHSSFVDQLNYHILTLCAKDSTPHRELCGKLIVQPEWPGQVLVEIEAKEWRPDHPPRYTTYRDAAEQIVGPLLAKYNQMQNKRLNMVIETQDSLEPTLPPVAKKAFDAFARSANKTMLHPNDWRRFYRFVANSNLRKPLSGEDMARMLIKEGFSEEYADSIGGVYEHLRAYKAATRRK